LGLRTRNVFFPEIPQLTLQSAYPLAQSIDLFAALLQLPLLFGDLPIAPPKRTDMLSYSAPQWCCHEASLWLGVDGPDREECPG